MATLFHLTIAGINIATIATTQMHWLVSALNYGSIWGNLMLVGMWVTEPHIRRRGD